MNLNEFIKQVIIESGLESKATERGIKEKDVYDYIYSEARKVANGESSIGISDEDVRKWIVHYVEDAYKEKPQAEKSEEKTNTCEEIVKATREAKKVKDDEFTQQSIFEFGEGK